MFLVVSCGQEKNFFSQGLKFTISEDGRYYLVSLGDCKDENVIIPSTYDFLPVKAIKEQGFYNCKSIKKVEMPSSIEIIEPLAFSGCENLAEVSFSNGLKNIENNAFSSCLSLKSLVLPETVETIGYLAFSGCIRIEQLSLPKTLRKIGAYAFSSCGALKSVFISENVTEIGYATFKDCQSLINISVDKDNENYISLEGNLYSKDKKVLYQYALGKPESEYIIPQTTITIFDYACYNSNLTKVIFPDCLTKIGFSAFEGSETLRSVEFGSEISHIGNRAFYLCSNLTEILFYGTSQEWRTKEFGKDNFIGCVATTVKCVDAEINLQAD